MNFSILDFIPVGFTPHPYIFFHFFHATFRKARKQNFLILGHQKSPTFRYT